MTRPRKFPARRPAAAAETPWYEIRNAAGDKAEVFIYDRIGESFWDEGITAKQFAQDLRAITATQIDLHLNSPGGSVFDGQAIYNALLRHPASVTTYIDGLAASIASVIALAGDHVVMADNALFMIHNPSAAARGDANEMRKMADLLDKVCGVMVNTYEDKTGMDRDELEAAVDAETWYTAAEALEAGFIDEIGVEQAIAAAFDLEAFGYRNYPGPTEPALAAQATTTPATPQAAETTPTQGDTVDQSTAVVEATAPPAPAFVPRAHVQDAFPYRSSTRDDRGMQASFFRDMLRAKDDPEAASRFSVAQTMITAANDQADVNEIIPTIYRPDMWVGSLENLRPTLEAFSRETIDGPNPLRVPKFSSAADLMSDHVENTNPSTGSFVTTEQVITPVAKSGSYLASREMIEGSTPAVDALIFREIFNEYALDTEAYAVTTFLAGATAGTVVDISDGVSMQLIARMITFNASRKRAADVALFGQTLFSAAATQVDTAGRPLNPSFGAQNATGQAGSKLLSIDIGGYRVPMVTSLTGGLLGVREDAWTFESGLRTWRWEEKSGPAKIELAAFGYIVCAVTRAAGLLKFATQA